MDLDNKFEVVRAMIVGQKVRVSGGPCADACLLCTGFERWPDDPNQFDIIGDDGQTGARIGVGIDEIHPGGFSGRTVTLSRFVRRVEII